MYKRYALGENKTTLEGVVTFFVFCSAVVWLLPIGIESVAGHDIEVFMIPPIWRGDVMCSGPGGSDTYTYTYTNDTCVQRCKIPGCPNDGAVSTRNDAGTISANLEAARTGLDIGDVYNIGITALRYGTVLAALMSLGVMGVRMYGISYLSYLYAIPFGVGAAAAIFEPALLPVSISAWCVSYGMDMWSTSRFGESVRIYETNPLLRILFRNTTIRNGMICHTILYVSLICVVSYVVGIAGPIPADVFLAATLFGLAAGHMWAAANNVAEYKRVVS